MFPRTSVLAKRYLSVNASNTKYDIIIAGGGMVGTTLACRLGNNDRLCDKKILLLESSKTSKWKLPEKFSNRVSSLNMSTVNLLKDIHAWDNIASSRFASIKCIQMWDALSDAMITFQNDNLEPLAYVVENDVLLEAVRKELLNTNVEVVNNAKIKSCIPEDNNNTMDVLLEDGTTLNCNLLLGCDGNNSLVRRSIGFHHIEYNYNQMGVVATLKLSEDCENTTAWQRHLPNSEVVALLPLKEGYSSLVWSAKTENAKKLLKLSDEDFISELNEALFKVYPKNDFINRATTKFDSLIRYMNLPSTYGKQLPPKVIGCENRAGFPLGLGHSTNYIRQGVVLVGDAAHRIHPMAGQGVNLGFGDVVHLNQVLGDITYSGAKLDNVHYLKQYETERQRRNIPMMLAVHSLFHLYGFESTPLVILRSLGLQVANALPPLKNFFISQASG